MKQVAISLAVVVIQPSSIFTQTFTLKSKDIGGQMTLQQVLNGFGCTGQNLSPQFKLGQRSLGGKEFRNHRLRQGRADGERLVALDCLQHPRFDF